MNARRPRLYCGTSEILPIGYDGFGTSYDCLRKGVGVGLYVLGDGNRRGGRSRGQAGGRNRSYLWLYVGMVLILLLILGLVIYLIVRRNKEDDDEKEKYRKKSMVYK